MSICGLKVCLLNFCLIEVAGVHVQVGDLREHTLLFEYLVLGVISWTRFFSFFCFL